MVSKYNYLMLVGALFIAVSFQNLSNSNFHFFGDQSKDSKSMMMSQYDVALRKTTIAVSPIKFGTTVPFQIFVYNQGTDPITNVKVIDYVPSGLQYDAPLNGIWSTDPIVPNAYITTIPGPIASGDSVLVTINLIPQATTDIKNWINSAEIYEFSDGAGNNVSNLDMDSTPDKIRNNDAGGAWKSAADNAINGDGSGVIGGSDPFTDEDDQDVEAPRIFDLALKKVYIGPIDVHYGDTLPFKITVYNQGNEMTGQVIIKENIPEGYLWNPSINFGWVLGGSPQAPFYAFTGLNPGDSVEVTVNLVLLANMFDGGAWDNFSEIFSMRDANNVNVSNNDADSTPNSNSTQENAVLPGGPGDNDILSNSRFALGSEDDHDPAAPRILDMALIKERSTLVPSYSYTQTVVYNIILSNQGNVPVDSVYVVDSIPCGLSLSPMSMMAGWTLDPITMKIYYVSKDTIFPSTKDTFELFVDVNPCLQDPQTAWTNYAEIYDMHPVDGLLRADIDSHNDTNLSNDAGGVPLSIYDNYFEGNGIDDEDDHDPELLQVFDLAIKHTIASPMPYTYGQTLDFLIRIYNQGNVAAQNIQIEDIVPEGYTYSQAVNGPLGWDISSGDTINMVAGILMPGDSTDIHMMLTVKEASNPKAWFNFAHIYLVQDTIADNFRFDDADSFPFTPNAGELAVVPGSPQDDDIFANAIPNTGQDEDDADVAGFSVFDLSLRKEVVNPILYHYGSTIDFNITVKNEGGIAASAINIVDYMPCGFTFSQGSNPGWTLNNMTGYLEYASNSILAIGDSIIIPLRLTVVECTNPNPGAWVNVAEIKSTLDGNGNPVTDIDSNPDAIPDNDPIGEDDIDSAPITIFDLALSKTLTSNATNAVFQITVTNQGNTQATNVQITDYMPCGYTFAPALNPGWTLDNMTGYLVYNAGTIESGNSFSTTLTLMITSPCVQAADPYLNLAEISSNTGPSGSPVTDVDSNPDNNPNNDPIGEDDIDGESLGLFDLELTKTIISPLNNIKYGDNITFQIGVKNNGNIIAANVQITDYIPCGYSFSPAVNPGWTLDNMTGYLVYNVPGQIAIASTVNVPLVLTIVECTGNAKAWENVAEISHATDGNGNTIPDIDSTPDNNPNNDLPGEDDIDNANINIFDLALEKNISSSIDNLNYGSTVSYAIVVTNQGNVNAVNVKISDYLPCGLGFNAAGNPGWTLNAMTGYLDYTIPSLGVGSMVVLPLHLTLQSCIPSTTTTWRNGAEITSAMDDSGSNPTDIDSTPDNNPNNDPASEDDSDFETLDIYDLTLAKTITSNITNLSYGDNVSFSIALTNQGSMTAKNILITDYLRCGYAFNNALNPGWTKNNVSGYLEYTISTNLAPGATVNVPLILSLQACNSSVDPWLNKAEITSSQDGGGNPGDDVDSTPDNNPNNDPPGEDDNDEVGINVFDLALDKTVVNLQPGYEIGNSVDYTIHVSNQGNLAASNITVTDYLPCGLSFNPTINAGWTLDAMTGYLKYTIPTLAINSSVNLSLTLKVIDCSAPGAYNNAAEISSGNDPSGNPGDDIDSTPDSNPSNDPVSEDDSDDAPINVVSEAIIGDFVWHDLDGDGIQDANEPGIPGVIVKLYNESGTVVATTTTNANGLYTFTTDAGNYYLGFTAPAPYEATLADVGSNNNIDSDINASHGFGTTSTFTLVGGVNNYTIDAGFYQCVKIGELVWYDTDKDDIWDPTENGLNGMRVELWKKVNGVWTFFDFVYTGHKPGTPSDDGYFNFCVNPGEYYVKVVLPPLGLVQAKANVLGYKPLTNPTEQRNDSDLTNTFGPGTTESFVLTSGASLTNIGAGFYPMATAGNLVWEDNNFNGVQDLGEERVPNVLVEAFDVDNNKVGEDYTDENGIYEIDYLSKESYYLRFSPPAGYSFTMPNTSAENDDSDVDNSFGMNTTTLFQMQPGVNNINIDAGIVFSPLPVDWLYVKAEKIADHNLVTWATAKEVQTSDFIIERRLENDNEFREIASIKAAGYSNKALEYNFEDKNVSYSGLYYYRIKQVDINAVYEYSKTVEVNRIEEVKFATTIYPNPAVDKLNVKISATHQGPLELTIYDSAGKLVKECLNLGQLHLGENEISLSLQGLNAGVFNVVIRSDDNTSQHKLIIIR